MTKNNNFINFKNDDNDEKIDEIEKKCYEDFKLKSLNSLNSYKCKLKSNNPRLYSSKSIEPKTNLKKYNNVDEFL